MKSAGIVVSFMPFFWTLDFSYQDSWHALSIEIGPLAIRILLPRRGA